MKDDFLLRKAQYIFNFVNNENFVNFTTDIFRFPNITAKQLGEIMISPDNEAELKFANSVLDLSMTMMEHQNITISDSRFDAVKNSGYDYYEFGVLFLLDAIKELKIKYSRHDEESRNLFLSELNNTVLDIANDAKNKSIDEYHQICCDVNILESNVYTIQFVKALLSKDEVTEFAKQDDSGFPMLLLIAANIEYLGQALFIGDKKNLEGSKDTLTEEDLDLATQFTERFNAYMKSLVSFTRK